MLKIMTWLFVVFLVGCVALIGWDMRLMFELREKHEAGQRVYLYEQADYAMQRGGMPVPAGAKIVGFTCLPHGEDVECYTAFTK